MKFVRFTNQRPASTREAALEPEGHRGQEPTVEVPDQQAHRRRLHDEPEGGRQGPHVVHGAQDRQREGAAGEPDPVRPASDLRRRDEQARDRDQAP